MNQKFLIAISVCLSFSLNGMDGSATKGKETNSKKDLLGSFGQFKVKTGQFTSPKAQSPTTFSSAMLAVAKTFNASKLTKAAKLAAAITSGEHPTAVYFRAALAKSKEEKEELKREVADINPHRASAAVKETNMELYRASLKLAHESWTNIPRFTANSCVEEAAASHKTYEAEIRKAQERYFNYQRSEKYETSQIIDEKELKEKVLLHFLKVYQEWNLESAAYYWNSLPKQLGILSDEDKQSFYQKILDKMLTSASTEETFSLLEPIIAETEKIAAQSGTVKRRDSNVDAYARISRDSKKQTPFEVSAEQFMKHIAAAKSFCRELLRCTINPEPSQVRLDELVNREFVMIKKELEKERNFERYREARQRAHGSWIDSVQSAAQSLVVPASGHYKNYNTEIQGAQELYLIYLRSETPLASNEETLKAKQKIHFLELHQEWNLESATYYLDRLKAQTASFAPKDKKAFFDELLGKIITSGAQLPQDQAQTDTHADRKLSVKKTAPNPAELLKANSEQFMKHIISAKNHYCTLQSLQMPDLTSKALDTLVDVKFNEIKKEMEARIS